jgi:hypothetical protein
VEPELWATHLAHLSAREPSNLLAHVRRVYLHLKHEQSDALYGALLDLFLILGEKGVDLRTRLLKMSKNTLPHDCYDLFNSYLERGLQNNQSFPISQYSVFGNFFKGELSLFNDEEADKQNYEKRRDPLELAQEELTFGDINVAQDILEEAILDSPQRVGLHYGLLEIYKHTHSLSDLEKMQERLGEHVNVAISAWNKTRRDLEAKGN